MYVCMYVRTYVGMYVCMYVCMYVRKSLNRGARNVSLKDLKRKVILHEMRQRLLLITCVSASVCAS